MKRLASQLTHDEFESIIKNKQGQDFDRLYLEILADGEIDFEQIYNYLEYEYFKRNNARRYGDLFIPAEISFDDEKLFIDTITKHYSEDNRHYHNLKHIKEMLLLFEKYKKVFKNPNEVYLAIMLHDIIYDVENKDNEAKSAEFAREFLSKHVKGDINIDSVCRLINLTSLHGSSNLEIEVLSEDEKVFLDMDSAIFTASDQRLAEYEDGVFLEYSKVYPKQDYLESRIKFLYNFLRRDNSYQSKLFRDKFDNVVHRNLQYLIDINEKKM